MIWNIQVCTHFTSLCISHHRSHGWSVQACVKWRWDFHFCIQSNKHTNIFRTPHLELEASLSLSIFPKLRVMLSCFPLETPNHWNIIWGRCCRNTHPHAVIVHNSCLWCSSTAQFRGTDIYMHCNSTERCKCPIEIHCTLAVLHRARACLITIKQCCVELICTMQGQGQWCICYSYSIV